MTNKETIKADVCIIGAGVAGLAASLFAVNQGLSCVEVGQVGEINFATGFLDLLGVHPAGQKSAWTDPWKGIDILVREIPNHPYARIPKSDIRTAFEEVLSFLAEGGLPYVRRVDRNSAVLTSMGTRKLTYCVPRTMWNGVEAMEKKLPACWLTFGA
jgi:glycerol-3-phosphate dehydrogenase subunit B